MKMKIKQKGMENMKIIVAEAVFVIAVLSVVFFLYPRANVEIDKDVVKFNLINAKVIVISENPDFSNSRYLEIGKGKNVTFRLKPGKYYWKADNGLIEGLKKEFTIKSEVGMEINRTNNESRLVNVGNVKINITKKSNGIFVGHIILEPDESEKIEDKNETYIGRQNGE